MNIDNLWALHDENEWLDALKHYWANPAVRKNRDIELFMHKVDLEYIQRLDINGWYEFLNKYFQWKYASDHLHERLMHLDRNSFEHLFAVKCSLGAIHELDLEDSRKCLNLVKSPQIRGLDYPGASGLLALLFKEWFGTIDRSVLESLSNIEALPERQRIGEIRSWVRTKKDWKESDAVLIIDIMRRKAVQLNAWFGTNRWTPHKVAMILWTSDRPALVKIHGAQMVRRSDEQISPRS